MKRFCLLRHAKSSWDEVELRDFDRPLAKRGRKATPRIAEAMRARGVAPDLVLCSAALRTRQTWDLVAPVLGGAPEVKLLRTIYLAPPSRLLTQLRRSAEASHTVLLIGHNPGIEHLAGMLSGPGSDRTSLAAMSEKFPTAAFADLELTCARWADLDAGKARLTDFLRPRDLA